MKFSPPPSDAQAFGSLRDVAEGLARHVEAERRRSWDIATGDLRVLADEAGLLLQAPGHQPVPLERAGLDSLLRQFSACFPRAPTLVSALSPGVALAVWRDLFRSDAEGMPLTVKILDRLGSDGRRAVWGCTPPSFPSSYSVARFVSDLAERLPRAVAVMRYDAAEAELVIAVPRGSWVARVALSDQYGKEGLRFAAVVDGRDEGDPLPVKSRRRAAADSSAVGQSMADAVRDRVEAGDRLYGGVS